MPWPTPVTRARTGAQGGASQEEDADDHDVIGDDVIADHNCMRAPCSATHKAGGTISRDCDTGQVLLSNMYAGASNTQKLHCES